MSRYGAPSNVEACEECALIDGYIICSFGSLHGTCGSAYCEDEYCADYGECSCACHVDIVGRVGVVQP